MFSRQTAVLLQGFYLRQGNKNLNFDYQINTMKTLRLLLLPLFLVLSVSGQNMKVMTYNIRLDNPSDGANIWQLRKEFLSGQIQFYAPDFIGTQEGKLNQLQYLDSTLTDYKYIGTGRDSSPTGGEYSALFYNDKKYKVLQQSTFWLSKTPEKVSKGWDAMYERVCTYGLFEDKANKRRFYVFNTHLDHVGEVARENSARLIIDRISSINKEQLPVILTGDFNSETSSRAYKYISSKMNDTRTISQMPAFGPEGTFNNFEFNKPVTLLIDYVFVSKLNVEVLKYAILSDSRDYKYPSDHLPVYTELLIKQ